MTEPSSSDRTFTGDILRVFGAKMLWSHGPEKAGSVMVLHCVSRQQFSALAMAVTARRQAIANILVAKLDTGWP
jgi:hypothetical protein